MVQINFAKREVACKVVFYGPARSGKTANLRSIHERTPEKVRGALTTIATDTNRTLFFDFLPLNLGLVANIGTKINLYAVPYIANQNATRLLVLEGIDGIVFVADSSPGKMAENIEALENLRENLADLGRDLGDIPIVFQWNKSDAPNRLTEAQLNAELNPEGFPAFDATADTGVGVFTCLKAITQGVLVNVSQMMATPPAAEAAPATVAAPAAPVAAPVAASVAAPTPAPAPVSMPEPEPEPVPEHVRFHNEPEPPVTVRPEPALAAAETDPEPVIEEFERTEQPVEVMRAEEPEGGDVAAAEYEQAFGHVAPEPDSEAAFEPPNAVIEAAQSLAQPGNYNEPPRSFTREEPPPTFERHVPSPHAWRPPAAEGAGAEPDGPRMVNVGGRRAPPTRRADPRYSRAAPTWEPEPGESGDADEYHRRRTRPVTDRRRRRRSADVKNVVPTANIVAGAVCALVSLIAIGYLVFALL